MTPLQRLAELGIDVGEPLRPKGSYVGVRCFEHTAWVSGCTGRSADRGPLLGIVGVDLTIEQARAEAARAAVNLLAALESEIGLDQVAAVLHLRGYVRADPNFTDHPAVIDGASQLLTDVFGTAIGRHARTAVGAPSLPGGASVELEAVIGVRSQ